MMTGSDAIRLADGSSTRLGWWDRLRVRGREVVLEKDREDGEPHTAVVVRRASAAEATWFALSIEHDHIVFGTRTRAVDQEGRDP